MKFLRFVGPVLLMAAYAAGQPLVTTVENAASWSVGTVTTSVTTIAGLPNSGIAQGSIFTVIGTGLGPATLTEDPNPFQDQTWGGTSMYITPANNQIVNVPMLYTSATQVSGLLPSNTPLGAATLTVLYNGQPSNLQPITVVQNNPGIFTWSSNGQGAGIVSYPDYSLVSDVQSANCLASGTVSFNCGGAANPGDTLILWTTGLGPVTGNELGGAGLGVAMPNIPLTLWLGGVQANVTYQGRSGCCIGEDQIVFSVPTNVPTGCAVPLVLQIGNSSQISNNTVLISNGTVIPVASGSRTCTPTSPIYSSRAVQELTSGTPFPFGSLSLSRNVNFAASSSGNGLVYDDDAAAQFGAYTVGAFFRPFAMTYLDSAPLGTCLLGSSYNNYNAPPPLTVTGLDAGVVSVGSPTSNPVPLQETQNTGQVTSYFLSLNTFLSQRGAFTMAGAGGRDVGPFSANITVGSIPAWSNQQALITKGAFTVTRANGVTLTWPTTATSGVSSLAYIEITGAGYTDGNEATVALFNCTAAAGAGTFTVPPTVLAALPPGPYFSLEFAPVLAPIPFTASGLDVGSFSISYLTAAGGTLQ